MSKVSFLGSAALAGAALAWIAGCASSGSKAPQAMATIVSASGTKVQGRALFTQLAEGGVKAEVWIENATPGTHGLHLHEKGDCSAPDAASAGGHFNAAGNPHAAPTDKARHNGDLGNIEVGADGKGHLEITSDLLTVSPGPDSVVGRSIVFHEKADDLKTQPTGAAGARYGCGVILPKGSGEGNASAIKIR
jgi:Cu-Zn family superoxide dismutase